MKVAAVQSNDRGRSRSPKRGRFQEQRQGEKSNDDKKSAGNQVCGACFIHTDTVRFVQAGNETTKVSPRTKETLHSTVHLQIPQQNICVRLPSLHLIFSLAVV